MTSNYQMSKAYSSMQVHTASNPANICMLHTRCIFFVKQALIDNQPNYRSFLDKAQNIIAELEHALIIDDNLSRSLFYIYDYCYILLEQNDPEKIRNALILLTLLRDTFTELVKENQ